MTNDSIFNKIIKGEVPCHKVYEDDKTLAFLDIHPLLPGHTLVIPKLGVEFVWDLPDEDYKAVMETARKVARRLREVTGLPYVHLSIVGTDVPHAHVHVVPFERSDDIHKEQDMNSEPDHAQLAELASRLLLN